MGRDEEKNKEDHNMKRKTFALALAAVLLVGAAVGGTLAWLTDKTQTIQNHFTIGNLDITLKETDALQPSQTVANVLDADSTAQKHADYQMIPGATLAKDPKVVVKNLKNGANVDAYVFVKLTKTVEVDNYLDYSIDATKWTQVPGTTDVWYTKVSAADVAEADKTIPVLTNNQVTVKSTVTNAMMEAVGANGLDLTFQAYAIQQTGFNTPELAWAEVSK